MSILKAIIKGYLIFGLPILLAFNYFYVSSSDYRMRSYNSRALFNLENLKKNMVKAGLFQDGDSALSYDKDLWLKGAFRNYQKEEFNKRKVVGAILADNFATSNWYQYYLAVKWYKERFLAICKEHGLAIPG